MYTINPVWMLYYGHAWDFGSHLPFMDPGHLYNETVVKLHTGVEVAGAVSKK